MGLDMHLTARQYVSGWKQPEPEPAWEHLTDFYDMHDYITEASPWAYVEFSVGYWRKANHIHKWFVNCVQGGEDECRPWDVSREQLEQLRTDCLRVLAHPEEAGTVLPTQEGFFFGGTEYDESYKRDCQYTVKLIDKLLKLPTSWTFRYESSW